MKIISLLIALVLFVPAADAAVMASTKQKKLPVIANAHVGDDWKTFGFDVTKAPTTDAYDVWGRITGVRNKAVGEWFVRSMKLRSRNGKTSHAEFTGNLADTLAYSRPGTYQLTLFVCPANANKPTEKSCAHASVGIVKK